MLFEIATKHIAKCIYLKKIEMNFLSVIFHVEYTVVSKNKGYYETYF